MPRSKVEDFRARSNLLVGANNTTLSAQQLSEVNTQLSTVRAQKADAEAKAKLIRDMLRSGQPIEASDILNSELVRRLDEQRVTLRAQLAEQSSTLLDNHPRIKELRAQIEDLDNQIRGAAEQAARSLENDAKLADARVNSQTATLDQLKTQAASTNGQDVQLRALERDAKSQRDLLESYLAKYREATSRDTLNSTPADARIISRATVSNVPSYPKKMPTVLIATFATFLLSVGFILTQGNPGGAAGSCRCGRISRNSRPRDLPRDSAPSEARGGASTSRRRRPRVPSPASPRLCADSGAAGDAACRLWRRSRDEHEPDRHQACARLGRRLRVSCWWGLPRATPRSEVFRTNHRRTVLPNSPAARRRSATSSPKIGFRPCI